MQEIREHILDSEEALFETSEDGDKTDRVRKFLTAAEYERLDETSRNQRPWTNIFLATTRSKR